MNYVGMQADILELFREAQTSQIERAYRANAIWSAREVSEKLVAAKEKYYQHKALYRHVGPWAKSPPPRARVTTEPCALCGGVLEWREGNKQAIHVGICSR